MWLVHSSPANPKAWSYVLSPVDAEDEMRAYATDVCLIAEPGMLRGRRYGNVILVAAPEPDGLPLQRLVTAANRDPFPNRVVHGAALDRLLAGAKPVGDAKAKDSPAPPPALLE